MRNKLDTTILLFIICYILFLKIFTISCDIDSRYLVKYFNNNYHNINIIPYERQALHDLYISTNGNDWVYQEEGNKGYWNFTDSNVNPCLSNNKWQGLNCTIIATSTTDSYYYISKIILPKYNLNGFIPYSIGNFSQLQYLDLSYNYINKGIPTTIGNLSELIKLDISYNSLSGTLPKVIYQLSKLQTLKLEGNLYLHGTISNQIGELSQLNHLNLYKNSFTGPIPYTIGNLTTLTFLRISYNQLTGTIPDNIRNLTSLTLLAFSVNQLSGKFPSWIGELSSLTYISLGINHLTGNIPFGLCNLTSLNIFSVGNNYLTGNIPDCVGDLLEIIYLSFKYNQLTSTIPSTLSKLINLDTLYLDNNFISGEIPDIFQNGYILREIGFNHNLLLGTIPQAIRTISTLSKLFLQNNHFTGNLNHVFNASYQRQLNNIQLSNNQFTGKLPEEVFLSKSLTEFSAVSNCFHGSIPSSICDNTNLETLALDGLVCASTCRNKLVPSISSAYVSINEISGGIPKCLWSMPKLQVLHLSGNGLTGSLPDDVEISKSLVNLALSYNLLTGSIPSNIQQRTWKNIDLSHNRFYGSLLETFSNQSKNSSLSLNNNRLSGFIPTSLKYMKDIDILKGNSFACKYDRSDLPTYDNNKDTYECGSNTFNIIYYIWLGILTIIIIAIVLLWYNRAQLEKYFPIKAVSYNIWKWLFMLEYFETCCTNEDNSVVNKIQMMSYFKQYNALIEMMLRFSWYCTACIIIVLMPIYCVLSYYYRTHKHEYAWTVSAIYLSGVTAFAITISILLLFIAMQILLFMYSMRRSKYDSELRNIYNNNSIDNSDTIVNKNNNKWKVYCMYIIYISINLIIISGINTAYVLVVLYKSNTLVILATIAIAIFKVVWNNIISAMILRWVITYLSFINTTNQTYRKRLFMMQFLVSLLNNILIPCFIVAIISPNCFYYAFKQESEVSSSFTYQECVIYLNNICMSYGTSISSTSYSPPFTYSYQCSSDFITYYAPVFILICIISTFISPLIDLFVVQLSTKHTWISIYLPFKKLFLPINNEIVSPIIYRDQIYTFFISQLTLIGLLLTFGTIFPPLAVALLITIARRLCFHKATIARYIVKAIELKVYLCLDIIEDDCKVIPSFLTIRKCGFVILSISSIFYTLFLFDTLGDKVGLKKAYWVLIVMPSIPICMYVVYRLYVYLLKYKKKRNADSLRITTTASAKYEISNIYKNNIELSTTTTSVALMTSNPLLVMNTTTTTIEEGRDSFIRDLSVSDREDISIITTN